MWSNHTLKTVECKQNLKGMGFTDMGYYKYIYYKYIISYCNCTLSVEFSHSKNNDSMSTL